MITTPLGFISPGVTPGTPVQITADQTIAVKAVRVCQVAGQTGTVYFGKIGLKRSGDSPKFQAVIKQFAAPGTQFLDMLLIEVDEGNQIRLSDFYVDADNAGQGLLISYDTE